MRKTIAFIGVGNMASAIINGVTSGSCGAVTMSNMVLYDKYSEKTLQYKAMGATVVSSEREAVEQADCIFLCAKPQNFPEILPCFSDIPNVCNKLFVTIAAGIKMQSISDAAGGAPVIRVLPNTPIFIGKGVSAICKTQNVCDEDFKFVCNIFSSSSSILPIDEDQMNRIIGVTSSSPAYVFLFIKSIYEGALEQGLIKTDDNVAGIDENLIINSICDTLIGAAELVKSSSKSLDEQIQTVASKGGTTEQALLELERYKFSEGIVSAMIKCTQKADELGKK
ncbi:MAG: pyrroline-5-carboxylate reductase [Ruminococcaceae bacterium]|nr:pyrroline-5-carboxylate reductase [Oscillospiraceae bacterium]